jgi:hypothetical protein
MVITDLSEQKRKQAEEIKQAEATQRLLLERTLSRKRKNGAGLRANCMTKPASC